MEAKDVKWCSQHGYPLPCHKCGMPLSQLDQKEIYREGQRDIVEWIEAHEKSTCMDCSCAFAFRHDEWQEKLKEIG